MIRAVSVTRLVAIDDAPRLAELLAANRDFLAPWEPLREASHFTPAGQRQTIRDLLALHGLGTSLPLVILDRRRVVGRVTLSNIVRGAFQSCTLGYWLDETAGGRGLATRAVAEIVEQAFTVLGLHRVEAGTLRHNVRSQAVLARNGFIQYGLAPRYLHIAGQWQDHVMFQRLNPLLDSGA